MTKPNNPHAFPMISAQGEYSQEGMTLRDYFANSAMQGILSNNELKSLNPNYYVETAYQIADAMLKQRELNNQ
jgi:hypothetical protein